ncbi:AAA family ATPase [Pseudonocardia sp. NPDC049635]|uniref:AAA family ATPase n=1 Tax=Pseudonocardia sp. NPDC049635 TaxID=3155506 RepID=UPI0033EA2D75
MLGVDHPLPARPRRVAVAGVAGVGKTTAAARIAGVLGAPHTEIDALFHGPGWTPRPSFLDEVGELVAGGSWVVEWQYATARPLIARRADLLVWLDLPFWRVTFPQVLRRTVRRRAAREVLWNGNVEPPLHRVLTDRQHILRWAVSTRHKFRTLVPEAHRSVDGPTVVRLRSRSEVTRWIEGPLVESVRRSRH